MKSKSLIAQIKLWIHLHKSVLVSVFKLLVPMLFLIFIIVEIPMILRNYSLSNLDSETIGIIDAIAKVKGIHESETGGKIIIKNYKIEYYYLFEGKRIDKKEIILRESINLNQRITLGKLEKGDTILVKYDSKNLENSKISLKRYHANRNNE